VAHLLHLRRDLCSLIQSRPRPCPAPTNPQPTPYPYTNPLPLHQPPTLPDFDGEVNDIDLSAFTSGLAEQSCPRRIATLSPTTLVVGTSEEPPAQPQPTDGATGRRQPASAVPGKAKRRSEGLSVGFSTHGDGQGEVGVAAEGSSQPLVHPKLTSGASYGTSKVVPLDSQGSSTSDMDGVNVKALGSCLPEGSLEVPGNGGGSPPHRRGSVASSSMSKGCATLGFLVAVAAVLVDTVAIVTVLAAAVVVVVAACAAACVRRDATVALCRASPLTPAPPSGPLLCSTRPSSKTAR
jgi:hypothetical protein